MPIAENWRLSYGANPVTLELVAPASMDGDSRVAEIDDLLTQVAAASGRYLHSLGDRPVRAEVDVAEVRETIGTSLTDDGTPAAEVLAELIRLGETATVATAGPRYFGFVTGGSLPAALAAEMLAVAWDQNAALAVMSPLGAVTEEVAGDWIKDILGLPATASIGFVTGAQAANITCLATARHHVLAGRDWDVETRGLQGSPRIHCIVGANRHTTVDAAFRSIGLGTPDVVIDTDEQGRIRRGALVEAIRSCDGPAILCLQAGNVVSGAFDAFEELVGIAHAAGAWVHVDGAFGGWAGASPAYRHLTAGMGGADSWAVDGHKILNVPYDCGYALTAHPESHLRTCASTASYLDTGGADEPRDGMAWVFELSRRARGVATYAALRSLGRNGVADLVEGCCRNAKMFASLVCAEPGIEVLNDVVFNQVAIRFDDSDDQTHAVIAAVQAEGTCWAGGASWHGKAVMRWSVSNWSTTPRDTERSAEAVIKAHRAIRSH
jgi:glutamate/tyrosine decarboxylase-like PLP-dependent enzyme